MPFLSLKTGPFWKAPLVQFQTDETAGTGFTGQ